VTYWNRAAESLFGWQADEALGRDIADLQLTPADGPAGFLSAFDFDRTGRLSGEYELCRRDGSRLTALVTNSAMSDENGRPRGFISVAVDITDRKQLEQRLQQQAFTDALTGLANRALFIDRVDHLLARRKRQSADVALAVLFIDLDDFKTVNDSMGHGAGDELLVALAARLRAALRPSDTAARLGGDEFAVLLEDAGVSDAEQVARRLLADLSEPVQLGAHDVQMSASIGIAVPPRERAYSAEELLRDADLAMYRAKTRLQGGYAVYHASMHEAAMRRLELKADLQRAIESDGLELAYQPIVRLSDRLVMGAESLLRWPHADRGQVPVSETLALADAAGLTMQLAAWVLDESCREVREWLDVRSYDAARPAPFVSVNASARVLLDPSFPDVVAAALGRHRLPPAALTIEITESDLMHESEAAVAALGALKSLGVSLAIDDFGTGYSSLAYLARFPLDVLKIDRAFVAADGVGHDAVGHDAAIARAIVELARSLGMLVVAEGIESARERDQMAALEVDFGQGYFLGRPDSGTAIGEIFAARRRGAPRRAARGHRQIAATGPT